MWRRRPPPAAPPSLHDLHVAYVASLTLADLDGADGGVIVGPSDDDRKSCSAAGRPLGIDREQFRVPIPDDLEPVIYETEEPPYVDNAGQPRKVVAVPCWPAMG